jgi:hypothetical protein
MDFEDHVRIMVEREHRFGPCEDDVERTAPYVNILPDESEEEDGSPLDFRNTDSRR